MVYGDFLRNERLLNSGRPVQRGTPVVKQGFIPPQNPYQDAFNSLWQQPQNMNQYQNKAYGIYAPGIQAQLQGYGQQANQYYNQNQRLLQDQLRQSEVGMNKRGLLSSGLSSAIDQKTQEQYGRQWDDYYNNLTSQAQQVVGQGQGNIASMSAELENADQQRLDDWSRWISEQTGKIQGIPKELAHLFPGIAPNTASRRTNAMYNAFKNQYSDRQIRNFGGLFRRR